MQNIIATIKAEYTNLRVRAVFHKTVWVCHVYCNFKGTGGLCVRFKKNVDGQGTQAIIKNLNLNKSKRF